MGWVFLLILGGMKITTRCLKIGCVTHKVQRGKIQQRKTSTKETKGKRDNPKEVCLGYFLKSKTQDEMNMPNISGTTGNVERVNLR